MIARRSSWAARRPAVPLHAHQPAPGEPSTHDGRRVCAACRKPGRPGDAQHPVDALPLGVPALRDLTPDERALTARIVGDTTD